MTDEELARIEEASGDGRPCSNQGCTATGEDVVKLVAEVRRLRGLVQKAYAEGQFTTSYYGNGYIDTQPWDESDACKALDGAP